MQKTNTQKVLSDWHYSLAGAKVNSVGSGVRIQIAGKRYQPDRVEAGSTSKDGKSASVCHFSEVGLTLNVTVAKTDGRVALSGILHNRTDKAVQIEQMWFGECIVDLGGPSGDYRVYYNSGCQESSGTCRFAAIKGAVGTVAANTDPDAQMAIYASTCIQSDCVRSQYVTAIYSKEKAVAVCCGDTSFGRAETVFYVKPGTTDTSVTVSPVILYNGLPLDPGQELAVEEIAIRVDTSPLKALEDYVDEVKVKKAIAIKPIASIAGLWNPYYVFTEEEHASGVGTIEAAEYQKTNLLMYNIRQCAFCGVWHRDDAFFESRGKPYVGAGYADTMIRAARQFPDFHMVGGCFWGAASECSDFFALHPEAILRDKDGRLCRRGPEGSGSWGPCKSPSYWVDFSHPAAKEFFKAHLWSLNEADIRHYCIDFMGDHGEWKGAWWYMREDDNPYLNGVPYDAHMNRPFETDRVILQAIREVLGERVVIHSYTAGFMRYLGLVDVVRPAVDSGSVEFGGKVCPLNWDHLRGMLQNLAANYMFHGKWWWSDADALCVGTRVIQERREEFRVRSLLAFIVGGPITLGDKIAQMAPEQFRYHTINLPATGHAARPLDLFERAVPEIYHFPRSRTEFDHDLLTLINLTEAPRNYAIPLSDMELDGECLVFEFWTKELVEITDGIMKVTLPPLTSRHYSLCRKTDIPQVLGTDFHLSMGALEIGKVQWNKKDSVLSGTIRRPAKETGHIYFYVPERFAIDSAKNSGARISSVGKVLALDVAAASDPVAWQVGVQECGRV